MDLEYTPIIQLKLFLKKCGNIGDGFIILSEIFSNIY